MSKVSLSHRMGKAGGGKNLTKYKTKNLLTKKFSNTAREKLIL